MKILKKQVAFFAAVVLLVSIAVTAMGGENYDKCQYEHNFELVDVEEFGGGSWLFTVNSCSYSSSPHQHETIRFVTYQTFDCLDCGFRKVVEVVTYGYNDVNICKLHDNGK